MVGAKTYNCGNQLCRLNSLGNLTITVPPCLIKEFGSKVNCSQIKFRDDGAASHSCSETARQCYINSFEGDRIKRK